MYGKFFASAFGGSMVGAGPDVYAVWGYVIANANGGQVELNPAVLGAVIGAPPERMAAAIDWLCQPDPNSRNPAHDGRRLVKEGPFAYLVVSHKIYRELKTEDERREYNRLKQQEYRARNNVKQVVNTRQKMSATASASASVSNSASENKKKEVAPEPDADIPCPADITLPPDAIGNLEMTGGVPRWAIDAITADYVARYLATPADKRHRNKWLRGLSTTILARWRDPKQRPVKGQTDAELASAVAERKRADAEFVARSRRKPTTPADQKATREALDGLLSGS